MRIPPPLKKRRYKVSVWRGTWGAEKKKKKKCTFRYIIVRYKNTKDKNDMFNASSKKSRSLQEFKDEKVVGYHFFAGKWGIKIQQTIFKLLKENDLNLEFPL